MMKSYTVVLEREDDGGYSAWVPDLPGCASQGDTYDSAVTNIREAIESYLEAHRKLGRPVPERRIELTLVEVDAA